jgi:hypothetical protein
MATINVYWIVELRLAAHGFTEYHTLLKQEDLQLFASETGSRRPIGTTERTVHQQFALCCDFALKLHTTHKIL